ncbi:hypothetical protein [Occultella glacieicola]|uniref:hypothetical protein n=1 Tax=Occultella glacieicola TaxID=2518684 RepID=UPI001F4315BB|nr:hypothetical protein [Occultella glacieicola]
MTRLQDFLLDETLPRGLREAIPSEADLSSAADAAYDDLRAAHDQDQPGRPG